MEKDLHYKLMTETSSIVGEAMLDYLAPLKNEDSDLYNLVIELPKKKVGTFETRAYLLRMAYEVTSGKKWTKGIIDVAVAIELELCSMYYTNRVFDKKGGATILARPNNQIIAAMITRDLASERLASAIQNNGAVANQVRHLLDESNRLYYVAQYIELNSNNPNLLSRNETDTFAFYERRNYLMNASFYEKIATIGCLLAGSDKNITDGLAQFGRHFGMMLQTVNDIADFVPPEYSGSTDEKVPDDAYSDIRNHRITLPLIYSYYHTDDKDQMLDLLQRNNIGTDELRGLTERLVKNGSIEYAQDIARDYVSKANKSVRAILDAEQCVVFEGMSFLAYSNRYYKALRQFK